MPTANEPAGPASISFEEMAALAKRMREQAIDDPTSDLFVIFVAPGVMARLSTLTKEADHA